MKHQHPELSHVIDALLALHTGEHAIVTRETRSQYSVVTGTPDEDYRIDLKLVPSSFKYGIIHVPSKAVDMFPGYRRQFVLLTPVKPFIVHLTGAIEGTRKGAQQGGYLCHPSPCNVEESWLKLVPDARSNEGSLLAFYEAQRKLLKPGSHVQINKLGVNQFELKTA